MRQLKFKRAASGGDLLSEPIPANEWGKSPLTASCCVMLTSTADRQPRSTFRHVPSIAVLLLSTLPFLGSSRHQVVK